MNSQLTSTARALRLIFLSSAGALASCMGCDSVDTTLDSGTAGTNGGGTGGTGTTMAGTGGTNSPMAGAAGSTAQAGTAGTANGGSGGTSPVDPVCPQSLLALGVRSGERGPAPPTKSRFIPFGCGTPSTDAGLSSGSALDGGGGSPLDASLGLDTEGCTPPSQDGGLLDGGPGGVWVDEVTDLWGWARQPGIGVNDTTGAADAPVVTATSARSLAAFAGRTDPLYIQVCGMIEANEVRVASNKTIVGLGTESGITGGFRVQSEGTSYVSNVVFRNLRIDAGPSRANGDGIHIRKAHHVWVDHCELFNSTGQTIAIVEGSDYITLSWNHFHFTETTPSPEQRLGILIGDSGDPEVGALDESHLNVTIHHNWFTERVRQRSPRARFGDVHVLNNYYTVDGKPDDWAIWSGTGARVFIEGNYFDNTHNPHARPPTEYDPNPPFGQITVANNVYDTTTGDHLVIGEGFVPPYEYPVSSPVELPDLVMQGVGPR